MPSPDPPRRPAFTAHLDPEAAEAGAGQRGLLSCQVDSDPPAQLRLLHETRVVATSLPPGGSCATCSPRVKVTSAPNSLRVEIREPVLEDEGEYVCEANNTLGSASASVSFNAQGERAGQAGRTWGWAGGASSRLSHSGQGSESG